MHDAITELVQNSLLILGALVPIVDSPDNIPIFLALTGGVSSADRAILARKIAIYGFVLLIVSVLVGTHILAFFGISLPVVQVGGGMIVMATGWKLLNRPEDGGGPPDPTAKPPKAAYLATEAFYPLTMPLTVGPGSISIAIAVGANRALGHSIAWTLPVSAVLGCAALAVSIFLTYRFAEAIGRIVGNTAMNIIVRLSSFMLLCIGVQILWNGASELLRTI